MDKSEVNDYLADCQEAFKIHRVCELVLSYSELYQFIEEIQEVLLKRKYLHGVITMHFLSAEEQIPSCFISGIKVQRLTSLVYLDDVSECINPESSIPKDDLLKQYVDFNKLIGYDEIS